MSKLSQHDRSAPLEVDRPEDDRDLIKRIAEALDRDDERARLLRAAIRRYAEACSYRSPETELRCVPSTKNRTLS